MKFFLSMTPPTATAQERKVAVVHGVPRFYDPKPVQAARALLMAHLRQHVPAEPLSGPLELRAVWRFPRGRSHRDGEWRVTRPDTDNLQKLLKDCMTRCGFWHDDAQVVRETVEKRWADELVGIEIEIAPPDNDEEVVK